MRVLKGPGRDPPGSSGCIAARSPTAVQGTQHRVLPLFLGLPSSIREKREHSKLVTESLTRLAAYFGSGLCVHII
jgi:hypothetical protein